MTWFITTKNVVTSNQLLIEFNMFKIKEMRIIDITKSVSE